MKEPTTDLIFCRRLCTKPHQKRYIYNGVMFLTADVGRRRIDRKKILSFFLFVRVGQKHVTNGISLILLTPVSLLISIRNENLPRCVFAHPVAFIVHVTTSNPIFPGYMWVHEVVLFLAVYYHYVWCWWSHFTLGFRSFPICFVVREFIATFLILWPSILTSWIVWLEKDMLFIF